MKSSNTLALLVISLSISDGSSFLVPGTSNHAAAMGSLKNRVSNLAAKSSKGDDKQPGEDMNPVTKASWYAVEAFGKIFAPMNEKDDDGSFDESQAPSSLKETLVRIQSDNDRQYFLSGKVDRLIYDEQCIFADPFVSFAGRDRFVENLQNLGSFITKYDAKMLGYEVSDDGLQVDTKVMVKLELNLPWKPILAWPWGVKYTIDESSCLVTDHIESWNIAPVEGVKQIFRKPTLKI
mmetsp:Transcript_5163/g.7633  ORF Transcript_5163/g.7633 Transcript_5163/m.7633 type:complete len:236 (+) Transcript_5163:125-832(+)